jgi:hypothetical protein
VARRNGISLWLDVRNVPGVRLTGREMDLGKPAPPIPVADAGGLDQDDTGHGVARAIGYQVRIARNRHGMTVARLPS